MMGGVDLNSFPPQYLFHYHNDERDQTIRQFNHMQALWGKGTYFLSAAPNQPIPTAPVELENEYNVFKTIMYNVLPTSKNNDGRVGLAIVGSLDEVKRDVDKIAPHLQHNVLKELLQP